ncbi:TrmH family RNA methyltransferase [Candidatus Leptofilum sp.]|uniref:TrmH family RNA methyltransferase n=1 Tax=Candidatus Leptofilum sp. TaxID=3241576 RepID=UPI003B5B398C
MITSPSNAKVKFVRRLQTDRRFRYREQQYVVEGTRWLTELVKMARPPELLCYTEQWLGTAVHAQILQQLSTLAQSAPLLVSESVMQAMSDTSTPAGILAVLSMQPRPLPQNPTLLLVLDAINTPGNLGTMLRTAGAAGVDGVLLGPDCVDLYNPKVVRGSMGAHLRLPVHSQSWAEIANTVQTMQVWLATIDAETAYTAVNWTRPSVLIIGSEAAGAGHDARQLTHHHLTIPMPAATESLNAAVATGIILFEAARQRLINESA